MILKKLLVINLNINSVEINYMYFGCFYYMNLDKLYILGCLVSWCIV